VRKLKDELAPGKNQLIVLWGAGGVGKTTLAAEAARALSDLFYHRVAWVSPLLRADLTLPIMLDEIAAQLGHPDLRKLPLEEKQEEVSALIAAAPPLIVLDNFETITPEEQTNCINFLAQRASCPALITTRTRIDDAYNIPLAAMSLEEAREFLRRLIEQTRQPSKFDKMDRDDLIRNCEANPLVLQWVVRQIDLALPPQTVLNYLAHGVGDAAERVFDRSFNLSQVGDDGRAVLLALSLFVPSASREMLAEVAGFGGDLSRLDKALEHLAALWLIETTDDGERLFIKGLTRELAKARLSKDVHVSGYRQRFIAYFLSYAEGYAQPTPEDFDALEAEKDNLLNVIDIAFDSGDWESVLSITDILVNPVIGVLSVRGYWDEAIRRGEQAVVAARETKNEGRIAQFAVNIATIRKNRGEYDEARQAYQQALVTFKKLGSDGNVAVALHQLGLLAQDQGEMEEARRLYNESLEIAKRLGDQSGIAISLNQLAMLAQDQGEIEEARRLYNESLEIRKRLNDQSGIAITLHNLAAIAQDQGEMEEARRLYNESLEIAKRLGDQSGIAITLHELGRLAQAKGNSEEARRLYNESLEIKKKLGNQSGIALTLGQLGLIEEKEGNKAEAVRLTREALDIFEKLKSPQAEISRRILKRLEGESS
jgi:tetratricopeptide (TPR) repeat protein